MAPDGHASDGGGPEGRAPARGPLVGRVIVTTREHRGELDERLEALGAATLHVPLLRTDPPADPSELERALSRLDRYDWVVVTSKHGATAVGGDLGRSSVRIAAVGTATAAAVLDASGREPDLIPVRQTGADLVAAFPETPARVLVAQADRAEPTVVDGLRAAGHEVDAVVAYRTVLRHPDAATRTRALAADAVTFASGSAAAAWAEAIGPTSPPVVVAIGPSTESGIRQAGLKITAVATDHSVDGLVDAVVRSFATAR